VGAVPRLIVPGETGLLVPPKDVQALKIAILKLLNDSSLRARLGNAGEALIKRNHSRDRMAQNYLQLYEQIARPAESKFPSPETLPEKQVRASVTYER
jgi:glycosyltransferase involved in cell wall biosynthesis